MSETPETSSSSIGQDCEECGMAFECADDLFKCHNRARGCGATYCYKCALVCSYCAETLCPLCAEHCSGCSAVHCDREVEAFVAMSCCDYRLCVDCVEEMAEDCCCGKAVCREHAHRCACTA